MDTNIPSQMKAAAIDKFGGPEVLHTEELPVPAPGEGELLLRVDTAGIGVWDPWVREGGFDDGSTRFPFVIGNDGAGTVVAVGPGVNRFQVGDRVYGFQMEGGFYAEFAKVPQDLAAPIPKGLSVEQAGVLGADGITALCGLQDHLKLQPGQSLMIVGASGGIGHLAVQLAKRIGARVLAVASRADGVALVRRLGADAAVDGRSEDVAAHARRFAPEGLDAALVLAGGDAVNAALETLKRGGRVAYPHGVEPEPRAPDGVAVSAYDGVPSAEVFRRLDELISQAPFHVELGALYALDEVAEAHRTIDQHHLGKLAIRIH